MTLPAAVVLAGGQGSRIKHLLPGLPKPLATVAGRPFLEWVLRYLRKQGVQQAVLSTGYRAEQIDGFVSSLSIPGMVIRTVREESPLGTAGGFLHSLVAVESDSPDVLVCNGDSLVLTDLSSFFASIRNADAAILGVPVDNAARFGTLRTNNDVLLGFDEKRPGIGLVNGGVYLFRRSVLADFQWEYPVSFEYDVFPTMVASGRRIVVVSREAAFLDIGTENSLREADAFVQANLGWFN